MVQELFQETLPSVSCQGAKIPRFVCYYPGIGLQYDTGLARLSDTTHLKAAEILTARSSPADKLPFLDLSRAIFYGNENTIFGLKEAQRLLKACQPNRKTLSVFNIQGEDNFGNIWVNPEVEVIKPENLATKSTPILPIFNQHLVTAARSGDPKAFAVIWETYLPLLNNYITHRYYQLDVNEVLQDLAIRLLTSLPRCSDSRIYCPGIMRAYFLTAARNICKNIHRYNHRHFASSLDEVREGLEEDTVYDVADHKISFVDGVCTRDVLSRAYDNLKPKERRLFHAKYIKDLPSEEIAALLDISLNTLGVRLYRLRNKLARNFSELA